MKFARPLIYAAVLFLPIIAFAQGGAGNQQFVPLLPSLPGISSLETSSNTATFLTQLYKICIGAAAVIAVLQIMRAGVLYMGGDSFTEKEQARSLISTSIIGLLLVLAPTIVFSIINPDILKLNIDTSKLGTDVTGGSGGTTSTAGLPVNTDSACKDVTLSSVSAQQSCPSGSTQTKDVCCTGLSAGAKCCSTPKNPVSTPQKPTISYGWRGRFVPKDQPNAVPAVQQQGPFATQAACSASMTDWPLKNGLSSTGDYSCNCNSPIQQQSSCTGF